MFQEVYFLEQKKSVIWDRFSGEGKRIFCFCGVFNHLIAQNEAYKFVESDVLRDFPLQGIRSAGGTLISIWPRR